MVNETVFGLPLFEFSLSLVDAKQSSNIINAFKWYIPISSIYNIKWQWLWGLEGFCVLPKAIQLDDGRVHFRNSFLNSQATILSSVWTLKSHHCGILQSYNDSYFSEKKNQSKTRDKHMTLKIYRLNKEPLNSNFT